MMGMRVTDTLAFMRGGWQLDRVLTDHRSGTRGRFTGLALVSPAAAGLSPGEWQYTETGELVFGAHSGPATRRLRYQEQPGGTVAVRFADGRPFYVLDLRSGYCQAEHGCGPDHYLLSHRVLGQACWKSNGGSAVRTRTTWPLPEWSANHCTRCRSIAPWTSAT